MLFLLYKLNYLMCPIIPISLLHPPIHLPLFINLLQALPHFRCLNLHHPHLLPPYQQQFKLLLHLSLLLLIPGCPLLPHLGDLLKKNPHLIKISKIGRLACKLAQNSIFGEDILKRCTPLGKGDFPRWNGLLFPKF